MTINDFKITAYGWQELALLYAPNLTPASAAKRLGMWITENKQLQNDLVAAGWKKGKRLLTPRQVQLIVEYLGEP